MTYAPVPEDVERIGTVAVDVGLAVHRLLGPGFKERIYQTAYRLELERRGVPFECEKSVEVRFREWLIPGQRIDLIVAKAIVVEVKAVSTLKPIHRRQVVSYLKTTGLRLGYVFNFHTVLFKDGVRRIVL